MSKKLNIFDSLDPENKLAELKLLAGQEQLKNIFFELLGKTESIERSFSADFELNVYDLLEFNKIILGKIAEQNELVLNVFTTTVFFEDESTRTVNSVAGLRDFDDVKNLTVNAVQMRWSLLVNMTDQANTHKQEVELTFDTTKYDENIVLIVKHTTKYWGFEVDQLFKSQIETLIFKPGFVDKLSKWFYLQASRDLYFSIIALLIVLPLFGYFIEDHYNDNYHYFLNDKVLVENFYKDSFDDLESVDISRKVYLHSLINGYSKDDLDSIATYIPELRTTLADTNLILIGKLSVFGNTIGNPERMGRKLKNLVYFLGFLILLIIAISFIVSRLLLIVARRKSFILLTEKSLLSKKRSSINRRKEILYYIFGLVMAIVSGVVSTWIYDNYII